MLDNLKLKSQGGVGIVEYENDKPEVVAYPNPSTNMIIFYPNKKIQGDITLVVYDVSGKKVKEEFYNSTRDNLQLNISLLKIGLYHYEVTGNNFQARGKFMKE